MDDQNWYRNALIYQIYPRSFADSSGDGIGDLRGIISHLDYLEKLKVDALWISPVYKSPMVDFGYDISDYYDIDPLFGNMADFDNLVLEAKKRNIKIIMDLVVNHTSDQNAWFIEARSSKDNPKRDWYTWKDPKADGSPPNNWTSIFEKSAWTLDEQTGQYYLHTFFKQQPDLNWENEEVRQEVQKIIRFWFERGVYGIRADAIQFITKDTTFADKNFPADGPVNQSSTLPKGGFGPKFKEYIEVMTSVVREFPGRFITFESDPHHSDNPAHYLLWYKMIDCAVAAPFYYSMVGAVDKWDSQKFGNYVNSLQHGLPENAMPVYFYSNHDLPRLASRIGNDNIRTAALALIMMPGIRVLYYGDEIGMKDVKISASETQDTGRSATKAGGSRDASRTPMQWSPTSKAGFSSHKPWLPIDPDYESQNVETLSNDQDSILEFYRRIIDLNKNTTALATGYYRSVDTLHPGVFAFQRLANNQVILILLNFTSEELTFKTPWEIGTLLISTIPDTSNGKVNLTKVTLKAHESWVIRL